MKNVMTRAWEIYKTLEGDHRAKLSLALRQAWEETKIETPEAIIAKLQAQGLKVTRWTKGGNDRLYVKGSLLERVLHRPSGNSSSQQSWHCIRYKKSF